MLKLDSALDIIRVPIFFFLVYVGSRLTTLDVFLRETTKMHFNKSLPSPAIFRLREMEE